ncbi:hypothetical protein BDP27DRAFT_1362254 [Rhodocollybia butyracea]|uniref:Uncharacterized protein n=1 Tax=Rhodocollybia butyracea TaxID=206335 RepID=A0A9P5PZB6_9AGAR|nr:hypothetical protein BDP27DRAFT_1362254 [Rhodocollybia butyracea]
MHAARPLKPFDTYTRELVEHNCSCCKRLLSCASTDNYPWILRDWTSEAPPPHPEIIDDCGRYLYGFVISYGTLLEYEKLHPDFVEQRSTNITMETRTLGVMRRTCRPLGIEHRMNFDFRILRPNMTKCEDDVLDFAVASKKFSNLTYSPTLKKLKAFNATLVFLDFEYGFGKAMC